MSMAPQAILLAPGEDPWRQAHGRESVTGTWHTFVPFVAEFLSTGQAAPCDIYRRRASGTFRRMLKAGEEPPTVLTRALLGRNARKHYYVILEDRDRMLHYQEDVFDALLAMESVPRNAKCRMIHNMVVRLTEELIETPAGLNLYRQNQNVTQLLEFVQAEPEALRELLRITPREYSVVSHSANVGFYALLMLLEHYHFAPRKVLQNAAIAFFLHDLGKSRLEPDILEKPGPLNDMEWWQMRRHPVHGFSILEREEVVSTESRTVVLRHHERIDGRGYPDALSGDDINPFARICSVADAFDSLTTSHPFRPSVGVFDALAIMREQVNLQFDAELFRAFVLMWKARFKENR